MIADRGSPIRVIVTLGPNLSIYLLLDKCLTPDSDDVGYILIDKQALGRSFNLNGLTPGCLTDEGPQHVRATTKNWVHIETGRSSYYGMKTRTSSGEMDSSYLVISRRPPEFEGC